MDNTNKLAKKNNGTVGQATLKSSSGIPNFAYQYNKWECSVATGRPK